MNNAYLNAHWALTIFIAPLTWGALNYIFHTNTHQILNLLEFYPVTLFFSVFLSLPTFAVYLICYHIFLKRKANYLTSKIVLITISVLGVVITLAISNEKFSSNIMLAYSFTALMVGIVLRYKKKYVAAQDEGNYLR